MKKHQAGFTLVELVTVIILIGILAVNVAPKFSGSSDFDAYTYRIQVIAALRLAQQRAMQQTHSSYCHQLVIESTRLGVPNRTDCAITTFPNGWQPDASGIVIDSDENVSFNIVDKTLPSIIRFDSMGRPLDDCQNGCTFNISSSEETVQIIIESEGFVHAL